MEKITDELNLFMYKGLALPLVQTDKWLLIQFLQPIQPIDMLYALIKE